MVSSEFNEQDKVSSYKVAMALLESINSFGIATIANNKSRHSYFGVVTRDHDAESWDISFFKVPKIIEGFGLPEETLENCTHVAMIFCNDDGKIYLASGGSANGYHQDAHMDATIRTVGELNDFLSTFHRNYMIHVADQIDRECMAEDFGKSVTPPFKLG